MFKSYWTLGINTANIGDHSHSAALGITAQQSLTQLFNSNFVEAILEQSVATLFNRHRHHSSKVRDFFFVCTGTTLQQWYSLLKS